MKALNWAAMLFAALTFSACHPDDVSVEQNAAEKEASLAAASIEIIAAGNDAQEQFMIRHLQALSGEENPYVCNMTIGILNSGEALCFLDQREVQGDNITFTYRFRGVSETISFQTTDSGSSVYSVIRNGVQIPIIDGSCEWGDGYTQCIAETRNGERIEMVSDFLLPMEEPQ
jgi:hypothetical protein